MVYLVVVLVWVAVSVPVAVITVAGARLQRPQPTPPNVVEMHRLAQLRLAQAGVEPRERVAA